MPKKPLKKKTRSTKSTLKSKPKKKVIAKKTKKTVKKQKISFIPKGYNSITPYLIVKNASQAIDFYKKAFGANEVMRMDHPGGKIGHAELRIGDAKIMLADEYPEMKGYSPERFGGTPVSIHLYIKDVDAIVERAVSLGAVLLRPVETMFYGDRSGGLKDPFGHIWYVSTHVENVSPAQMKKRAQELFGSKNKIEEPELV